MSSETSVSHNTSPHQVDAISAILQKAGYHVESWKDGDLMISLSDRIQCIQRFRFSGTVLYEGTCARQLATIFKRPEGLTIYAGNGWSSPSQTLSFSRNGDEKKLVQEVASFVSKMEKDLYGSFLIEPIKEKGAEKLSNSKNSIS